jgi:hypothetical protein
VLLDLDGAITSIVDLSVSTTSNLGADVTTSGTQTYTGAVRYLEQIEHYKGQQLILEIL